MLRCSFTTTPYIASRSSYSSKQSRVSSAGFRRAGRDSNTTEKEAAQKLKAAELEISHGRYLSTHFISQNVPSYLAEWNVCRTATKATVSTWQEGINRKWGRRIWWMFHSELMATFQVNFLRNTRHLIAVESRYTARRIRINCSDRNPVCHSFRGHRRRYNSTVVNTNLAVPSYMNL